MKKRAAAMIAALCLMGMVGCGGSGDSGGDTPPENKAPVASVEEADIKARVGDTVDLSAGSSSDEDNDTLTYAWTLDKAPSGSTAELSDPEIPYPSFVPDKLGMYRFKLVVSDGKAESAPAYVTVITGFTREVGEGVILEFAYIPPGTFTMGSPLDEPERDPKETPHEVTLTKGYYMMTTEMTNRQWETIDKGVAAPVTIESEKPAKIDSGRAEGFLENLNTYPEWVYHLPTEAQWEYAARAGSEEAFANGAFSAENLDKVGWYSVNSGGQKHEVALKEPNAWGLYDMHGNVREMCFDRWDGVTPYAVEPVVDPTGADTGDPVVRGGAYNSTEAGCRSATRETGELDDPGDPYYPNNIGFRLVRELETLPVADPGVEGTTVVGSPFQLDGSGSYDPDGYLLTYQWKLISAPEGSTARLSGETRANASLTPDIPGYYTFELTVDDGHSAPVSKALTMDAHVIDKVVLFPLYNEFTGELGEGGRTGADELVKYYYWLPWHAQKIHAFLSVTEEDCIKNMPKNFGFPDNIPVYIKEDRTTYGAVKVAENWADLMDGSLPASLDELGGLGTKKNTWWSGSKPDGTLADNCNGWTEGDGSTRGAVGSFDSADKSWLSYHSAVSGYEPDDSNDRNDLVGIAVITRSVHTPDKLRLFATGKTHETDAGGREGIDRLCREDANRPQGMPNTFGFVTVSQYDYLLNLPERYGFPTDIPITSPDGETVIANNWADLFDGTIEVALRVAGVFEGSREEYWWSGSELDGTPRATASNWTRKGDSVNATFGHHGSTDGRWLEFDTETATAKLPFLGIGF
ncbi:formylglycine-generating enzyme family protein [Desulfoluna spongiiphila]|nr:formylglycine-generating enzyme family protein [Desulfoluna spongiiphila]